MTDLHLDVDRSRGVRAGLEQALRESIRMLPAGARLPSSRALAADLGIARNTVAEAYSQLVQEGYLVGDRGAGTRVASSPGTADRAVPAGKRPDELRYTLQAGRPDISFFPVTAWNAAARQVLNTRPHEALAYADPRGPAYAREVLAGYLARVRGVQAHPDQIILCGGFRQAVRLIAGTVAGQGGTSFGHEHPGQRAVPRQLAQAGLRPVPLAVDDGGAVVDQLTKEAGVVLTPAHQFPTGVTLAPHRRTEVISWARQAGAIVLEDDYDGEFRYDRQPVGALQGLAPDVVAYAGSASKTLAPGLRLGWLVVPPRLVDAVVAEKELNDRHSDTLGQMTLATLIQSGGYDRQIRAARLRYRRRRDQLTRALAGYSVSGIAAGLHVLVELPGRDEDEVLQVLAQHGVLTSGLGAHGRGLPAALVLGYGAPPQHAWPATLAALTTALAVVG